MCFIKESARRQLILVCLTVVGITLNSAASAECSDPDTCYGTGALANSEGNANTGIGFHALHLNTEGFWNTALGGGALNHNTTGNENTATGTFALSRNTTGNENTANGNHALWANTTGHNNVASGAWALFENTTGQANAATGYEALSKNSTGNSNTATGHQALKKNTTGNDNTATGLQALFSNTTGINNTATGDKSLFRNKTGFRNVAMGYQAGYEATGSDNIIIGASNKGTAAENGAIRIGNNAFQKKTFIAGIQGVSTGSTNASAVFIDVNGQLGTIKSSGRYKEDIQPMGEVSDRLLALRPVTFRYKQPNDDGSKPVQFGLIAEEVAEAFQELVIYDEEGKPETVSYHLLATLLLNEFQKQHTLMQDQTARVTALEEQAAELAQLKQQVAMMAEVIERLDHQRLVATN